MQIKKGKGFILRKKDIGEGNIILEALLKDEEELSFSKCKLKSFGILKSKKRNPIVVEIGNYISVDYYYKENSEVYNIKEINLLERFTQIKKSYENFYHFSKIIQITNLLTRFEKDLKEVYELLYFGSFFIEQYFQNSSQDVKDFIGTLGLSFWDLIILFYVVRLLHITGFVGDVGKCSSCGQGLKEKAKWQEAMYFLCENCDLTANRNDFFYKEIIYLILKNKFINFIYKLKESIQKQEKEGNALPFLDPLFSKINLIINDLIETPVKLFSK